MEASACEVSFQLHSSMRSTTVLALDHDCLGSCLVLRLCPCLPLRLQLRNFRPSISRLARVPSTICCCFVVMDLRLPLICFSFDVRKHLSVTVSFEISVVYQKLVIWPLLFESFPDSRSTQRVLHTSHTSVMTTTSSWRRPAPLANGIPSPSTPTVEEGRRGEATSPQSKKAARGLTDHA